MRHHRPDGSPVLQFSLEFNHQENASGEEKKSRVDIVAIGKLAEFNLDLLQSGQPLMVIGKLNLRCWQTPEGKNRTRTEVIASDLRRIEEKSQASKPEK